MKSTSVLIHKKLSPLCYLPSGKLVCYRFGSIYVLENDKILKCFKIFNSTKEVYVGRVNLLNRFLRLGIRAAHAISDTEIVVSIGSYIYEINIEKETISEGFQIEEGIRPLIFTELTGISGFDDGIYFGGYLSNPSKKPVNIYKRVDKDVWEVIYTFAVGEINHIHNIIADKDRNCLWIFTGDFDDSAAIWKATEKFEKVDRILYGRQKYRGCVGFTSKAGLLYATDAPFEQNRIYLLDDNMDFHELCDINGSCIYGCEIDGDFVFSTTVEPDGRDSTKLKALYTTKRGAGIKDNFVYMYRGNVEKGFSIIYKEKKDWLPYCAFQFGVFKFPYGKNNSGSLYFQPISTKNDLSLIKLL